MSNRRGSRSSRQKRSPDGEIIMPPAVCEQQPISEDQARRRYERDLENYGRQVKAREERQQREREARDQKREALRRARRDDRRQQDKKRHAKNAAERHPVQRQKDDRLVLPEDVRTGAGRLSNMNNLTEHMAFISTISAGSLRRGFHNNRQRKIEDASRTSTGMDAKPLQPERTVGLAELDGRGRVSPGEAAGGPEGSKETRGEAGKTA